MVRTELTRMVDGRWRKKYRGRIFYFRGTYREALAQWHDKIKNLKNEPDPTEAQLTPRLKRLDWAERHGDHELAGHLRGEIETYRAGLRAGVPIPRLPESQSTRAVWAERFRLDDQQAAIPEKDRTIAAQVEKYLDLKRGHATLGKISVKRYDALRRDLHAFAKWFGGSRLVSEINEDTVLDYYNHLTGLVAEKTISQIYARDRMQAFKQWFVNHAWHLRLCERPRNLDSKELEIGAGEPRKVIFTTEEVKELLGGANDRLKLYLLLMLNTGMTQKDISDLRPDQVDWKAGGICRKRSKTGQHAGVPEVTWKLWASTFDLLKKYGCREGEHVFLNEDGGTLLTVKLTLKGASTNDNIDSAYSRLLEKINPKQPKPLKTFRKSGASKLAEHKVYGRFAQFWLGQSARTVADRNYIVPPQNLFDEAVTWLGKQFGQAERGGKMQRRADEPA